MSTPLTSQGRLTKLAQASGPCPMGGAHNYVYFKDAKQWTCVKCGHSYR